MVQGDIAADLNSYENAMWFTSSYMITIATMAPLVGRLSTIFTPGTMILVSAFFFAIGAVVTSQAHSFAIFILGRVLVGVGGGGIMTLSLILVLQLTSKRRRGLFIGIVNTGFTIGVSAGAVVFGALLPVMGWRALFWIQAPVGALAGLGVYLSMPDFAAAGKLEDKRTTLQKLAKIDYAGALSLVSTCLPVDTARVPNRLTVADHNHRPLPLWPFGHDPDLSDAALDLSLHPLPNDRI